MALAAAIRAVHDRVGEIHLFEQFLFLVAQYVRLLVLSVLGTVRVLVRFVGFTEFGEHGIVVLVLSEDEVLQLVHIERLLQEAHDAGVHQGFVFVGGIGRGGDDHDFALAANEVGQLRKPADELETVHFRHVQVQEDQLRHFRKPLYLLQVLQHLHRAVFLADLLGYRYRVQYRFVDEEVHIAVVDQDDLPEPRLRPCLRQDLDRLDFFSSHVRCFK